MRRLASLAFAAFLLAGCTSPTGQYVPTAEEASQSAPPPRPVMPAATTTADPAPTPEISAEPSSAPPAVPAPLPLAGKVVVLDAGHQLGNANFSSEINKQVDAGGGKTKACNTTGTATNGGFPEATVTWEVATRVRDALTAAGAEVVMTRDSNSENEFGPCINVRGSLENDRADLLLSIHADGAGAGSNGFHLLLPATSHPEYAGSLAFADDLMAALNADGLATANYVSGGMRASGDYATLNLSAKPAVIVEMGNMRNAGDAERLTSDAGQDVYAAALASAVQTYLTTP